MEMDAREPLLLRRTDPWDIHMRFSEYRSRVPAIAWPLAGAVIIVIYIAVHSPDEREGVKSVWPVNEALADCSPFDNFGGTRALMFDKEKHSVTESSTDTSSDNGGRETAGSDDPLPRSGTFFVEEETKSVTVKFGVRRTKFKLIEFSNPNPCILTAADESVSTLKDSWFGSPPPLERPKEWP